MLNSFLKIIGVFFTLALAGCVTTGGQFVGELASSRQSVGVYSGMPNEFHNMRVGLTVFNNSYTKFGTASWDMIGYAERTAQAQLKRQGVPRVEVIRTGGRITETLSDTGVFADKRPEVFDAVFQVAKAQGLQKVALITADYYTEGPADFLPPYGIWTAGALGSQRPPVLYTKAMISFYDVATRKSEGVYALSSQPAFGKAPTPFSEVTFKQNASQYTSAERRLFERALKTQLNIAIQTALRSAP
ncbi:MAG: hypothetical protein VX444_09265 [Pseudomonadota bacterium]|nr:hypothetical protein [Pseudomonadota bacterium]